MVSMALMPAVFLPFNFKTAPRTSRIVDGERLALAHVLEQLDALLGCRWPISTVSISYPSLTEILAGSVA